MCVQKVSAVINRDRKSWQAPVRTVGRASAHANYDEARARVRMSLPGYPLAYHANLKAGYPPGSDHNSPNMKISEPMNKFSVRCR